MSICCFLGPDNVYDADLLARLRAAIKKIAAKGDEIEFHFFLMNRFQCVCLAAALEAKQRYGERVTLTLLTNHPSLHSYAGYKGTFIRRLPIFAFDRAVHIRNPQQYGGRDRIALDRDLILRSMIRNADHIISCCYPALGGLAARMHRYAAAHRPEAVIDVTAPETAAFLDGCTASLAPQLRDIIQTLDHGTSYPNAMEELGLSNYTIHSRENRGRARLKELAAARAQEGQAALPPAACTLILPGALKLSAEHAVRFRSAVDYLLNDLGVSAFLFEKAGALSPYLGEFQTVPNSSSAHKTLFIPASPLSGMTEEDWRKQFGQTFSQIITFDPAVKPTHAKYTRSVKAMLARSTYVILNSAAASGNTYETVSRLIAGQKRLTVLDIGRWPQIMSPIEIR